MRKFIAFWQLVALNICAIAVVLVVLFALWWPDDKLHLITCDVGQGDAVLVTYGFHQILIDGGANDTVVTCLGEYMPWWDRTIELMVATHTDADHIGGLPGVLRRYQVQTVLINGEEKNTEIFEELILAVRGEVQSGATVKLPILGQQYRFPREEKAFFKKTVSNPPTLTLTPLSPRVELSSNSVENWLKTETKLWDISQASQVLSAQSDDSNNRSIVLLLEFGKLSALLTGDLEKEGELSLVAAGLIPQVTILKAGHHGSNTSSTTEFLQATTPEISLVSVGKNNRYGHPSPEVIEKMTSFDIDIWRTDLQGTIEVESDGERYWVSTQQQEYDIFQWVRNELF